MSMESSTFAQGRVGLEYVKRPRDMQDSSQSSKQPVIPHPHTHVGVPTCRCDCNVTPNMVPNKEDMPLVAKNLPSLHSPTSTL